MDELACQEEIMTVEYRAVQEVEGSRPDESTVTDVGERRRLKSVEEISYAFKVLSERSARYLDKIQWRGLQQECIGIRKQIIRWFKEVRISAS